MTYAQIYISWDEIEKSSYEIKNICQLFEEHAEKSPDQTALIYKDVYLSYKEINEKANQLARYIRKEYKSVSKMELAKDTLIPISIGRSANFVIGILGILKAGAAYVPINPDYPTSRIQFILEDISSCLMLVDNYSSEIMSNINNGIHQISLDKELFLTEEKGYLNIQISPDDLAYVIYTSGSTGAPKGVQAEHANAVSQVKSASYFNVDKTDTLAFFSDVAFDSTTVEIWGALLNGARLFIPDNFLDLLSNPVLFSEAVKEKNLTVLLITRALFDLLFTLDETVFAPLKCLLVGGEALTKNLMLKLSKSKYKPKSLINAYGPTENNTFCTTYNICDDFSQLHSVPIGKPYSNRIGYVLDKHQQLAPIGMVGELYVGGPSLARGYLNRPEMTQERFISNPFYDLSQGRYPRIYKTNDMIKWLPEGNLEYTGRNDFQVKLRGYRIELGEIETRLLEFPGINHSVVLLKKNENSSYLVGYYVSNSKIEDGSIRSHLGAHLPDYMIPSIFVYLETLPVTTNGKLDRKALPDPVFELNAPSSQDHSQPIEKTIHGIWSTVLNVNNFSRNESFFNLGGNSLSAMRVRSALDNAFNIRLNIVDLFQHTTLNQLSEYISSLITSSQEVEKKNPESCMSSIQSSTNESIAIVGMGCRIPGAKDSEAFWNLLIQGKSNLQDYSLEELRSHQVNEALINSEAYVKRGASLENKFMFDAGFFGISAKDAEIMDPQQRQFLECSWEALEHSGNVPEKFKGEIGVFASQGRNYYFMDNVYSNSAYMAETNEFQAILGNEKDFLSTRVSFKLNLTGPSITLQTACSSSLVSIQMACESLKTHGCDMALAGGASIFYHHGYPYQDDLIESPDGYCRAFDAKAKGTVVTSGIGIVVLKRLKDAIEQKDTIYAVIKGGAINNDGSSKMSFTAPSVQGQSAVIEKAIKNAGISPATITYIESHGTGTSLGDPIEWAALHKVYEKFSDKQEFCTIGALKTNIGHTDSAAGVLGVIKTALVLKNKMIPATLNFETLNPEIASFNKLFRVSNQLHYWENKNDIRRAAVSSFGIGGTNAHVILEEYNEPTPIDIQARRAYLLPISAKNRESLFSMATKMKERIVSSNPSNLRDYAFTAQQGRAEFKERGYFLALESCNKTVNIITSYLHDAVHQDNPTLNFIFSELEKVFTGQFNRLYFQHKDFRNAFDDCANLILEKYSLDIKIAVVEGSTHHEIDGELLRMISFSVQYALSKLLMAYKIIPNNLIFYGFGLSLTNTLSGKLSLDDAISSLPNEISVSNPKLVNFDSSSINISLGNGINKTESSILNFSSNDNECSEISFLRLLGDLWSRSVTLEWEKLNVNDVHSRKTPIPTYPFLKKHYEIAKNQAKNNTENKINNCDKGASLESILKELWANVLGISVSEISNESNFLNLGGDSLTFIDLLNNIKKSLFIEFSLEEIIEYHEFKQMFDLIRTKYESLEYE